jgi:thermitase
MRSRRRLLAALLGVLGVSVLLVQGAAAKDNSPRGPRIDPSTILVKFATPSAAASHIKGDGDRSLGVTPNGVYIVKLAPGRDVQAGLAAYRRHAAVLYAEPNYIRSIDLTAPDDPSYPAQWALSAIHALDGWGVYPGSYGSGVGPPLAVVDTGIDSGHPDLAANVDTTKGATCLSGTCASNPALDDNGHGTHVAGIAAAVTDNGVGIAGVGFASRIVPIKVLAANGSGSDASVASGIGWAVGHGARVVNLSLGGYGFSQTLCDAVANAVSSRAVVVAAAGNDGSSTPLYPAACPGAIGVAATASDGSSPSWSNWGNPNVFLSAPGVNIYSTYRTNQGSTYATLSGTSMATPHVSGVAALLLGQSPSRSPSDVRQIVARTAEKLGGASYGSDPYGTCSGCTWNPDYGYGQVDLHGALCLGASSSVASFSPLVAPAGGTVAITGPAVGCATSVSLGLVNAPFSVDSPTHVTATVPAGVGYGRWRVKTGGGTAVSDLVATVASPTIVGLSPVRGGAGSSVTLTGANFTGVTSVTLGLVAASFTVVSPTQITAVVPSGASYGRWRVGSPVWTAEDPYVFNVATGTPTFMFSPNVAPTGGAVTLTGSGLVGVSAVSLGYVGTNYTVDSPTQITATVPAGVSYGRWRATTGSGTVASDVFTVSAPTIAGYSPTSGGVGTTVTLTGSNFSDVTSVTLGYVAASFTVDSPTQITATVPAGLSYGRWRIANPVWTAAHSVVYSVTG